MMTKVLDSLTESAALVSVLMNTVDSELSLDDERSRLGLGLMLNSILDGIESAMLLISESDSADRFIRSLNLDEVAQNQ